MWIWLNFEQWSGGACNWNKWGYLRKRLYFRGRWTPFILYWLHLLPKQPVDVPPPQPQS